LPAPGRAGTDNQIPRTFRFGVDRLDRVQDQIQKYLLQLYRIAVHRNRFRRQFRVNRDATSQDLILRERQNLLDQFVQIQRRDCCGWWVSA
jgi:hypothetical protein